MTTVSLKAVSKYYEKQCILHDIHLQVEKGEFVVVVGPSGCGKSTLLRLIAGLDTVCEGSILINHRCVNKIPPALRNMAMVFQNYALYPHMTVFDNMAYGLRMRGIKKTQIQKRISHVAELLQLTDFLTRKPSALSGGQRQRVAMGRAMVRSPAVFLFDEPLSNLDAKLRTEMRHEIKKLHKNLETTFLYVTHDQTEAMTMADRIVLMNQGKIEQIGTPRQMYECPQSLFSASFIGQYPMNFLPGTLDLNQKMLQLSNGTCLPWPIIDREFLDENSVIVGVRPEHLLIRQKPTDMSFPVSIEFIDDLGSDRQIQGILSSDNRRITIRVFEDTPISDPSLNVEIDLKKAHLFGQQTGQRMGGWNDSA